MLLLLVPETLMLFMGQEFAASSPFQFFTDHDAALGRLVTEGRRREFEAFPAFAADPSLLPDPQDPATFERSKLRLDERRANRGVYRLYQDLTALRRAENVVQSRGFRRANRGGSYGVRPGGNGNANRAAAADRNRFAIDCEIDAAATRP